MQVLEAMKSHTYTILQSPWSKKDLDEIREMLKKHLTRVFLEGSV
jgi:predicted lipid-binding transport protein (Tim44 family)